MFSFHEKASDLVPPGEEANVEEGGRNSNDYGNHIWPIDDLLNTLLKILFNGSEEFGMI